MAKRKNKYIYSGTEFKAPTQKELRALVEKEGMTWEKPLATIYVDPNERTKEEKDNARKVVVKLVNSEHKIDWPKEVRLAYSLLRIYSADFLLNYPIKQVKTLAFFSNASMKKDLDMNFMIFNSDDFEESKQSFVESKDRGADIQIKKRKTFKDFL